MNSRFFAPGWPLLAVVACLWSTDPANAQDPTRSSPGGGASQDAAAPARIILPESALPLATRGGVVRLEFDRMRGTTFPVAQTRGGQSFDLTGIYRDGAGVVLVIDEDETDIAPLTESPLDLIDLRRAYITAAELDNLARHRHVPVASAASECAVADDAPASPCAEYFLYGIVVDHWFEDELGPEPGVLGIMWDTTNRSQFAMFYRNSIVRNDGARYLRSVAHEIGHAFNLHHDDGDGATTIMNQTGRVGNAYTFTFSDAERAHLQEHAPQRCSRPGTGSFTSVDAAHAPHRGVVADCR